MFLFVHREGVSTFYGVPVSPESLRLPS
uniref:Uncharacterized protein n=1 Tax=Anguilla anguilla TaxID=7936 RepID=A0A0E9PC31_ANGAN